MIIFYEVNVGTGCATGELLVPDDANDDDIKLAIIDDLYDVSYTTGTQKEE